MGIKRGRTQRLTQISKSKNVDDVGLMEEKATEVGKESSDLRIIMSMMKEQLHEESMRLRERLQEKETQLSTMTSLSMEALQCRNLSKSYALFLKEKWIQFQIKIMA